MSHGVWFTLSDKSFWPPQGPRCIPAVSAVRPFDILVCMYVLRSAPKATESAAGVTCGVMHGYACNGHAEHTQVLNESPTRAEHSCQLHVAVDFHTCGTGHAGPSQQVALSSRKSPHGACETSLAERNNMQHATGTGGVKAPGVRRVLVPISGPKLAPSLERVRQRNGV